MAGVHLSSHLHVPILFIVPSLLENLTPSNCTPGLSPIRDSSDLGTQTKAAIMSAHFLVLPVETQRMVLEYVSQYSCCFSMLRGPGMEALLVFLFATTRLVRINTIPRHRDGSRPLHSSCIALEFLSIARSRLP